MIDKMIYDFHQFLRGLWDKLDEWQLCRFLKSSHPLAKEFFTTWQELDCLLNKYKKGEQVNMRNIDLLFESLKQDVLKIYNLLKTDKKPVNWEDI
jgi:Zn-dependent M32 family carboxypeptidase